MSKAAWNSDRKINVDTGIVDGIKDDAEEQKGDKDSGIRNNDHD